MRIARIISQTFSSSINNREPFFMYDAGAVANYELDITALQMVSSRLVLAGGSDGRQYFPYLGASRLAQQIGTKLVEFPCNHSAFAGYPMEFATKLLEVLGV